MTEATSRPLRKDAARNRDLLVQAARDVFAERGLEASMDDVAHRAGLGVGTAYRHFANKYELAKAIMSDGIERVYQLVDDAAATEDAWAGLVSFVEGVAEMQSADRGLREVLMGVHDDQQMEQVNDRITVQLEDVVQRAKSAGSLRSDVEVSDIGMVVLMLCTVADIAGDASPDLWRRYLPTLLDGLRAGSPPSVPPISADLLRKSMSTHKQRLARLSQRG
jgi:AcrR family transcriptional regulator